ncbi:TPA: amino acid adenylation domain-containing protein [Serratia fonticola]
MPHTVLDYFIQQLPYCKNKPAIVSKNNSMTYQQLDDASNRLSVLLRQKGIRPGDTVPLVALRTPEMLIGLLAIVKAGASYIPIDARYPTKRIGFIIEQSQAPLILLSNTSLQDIIHPVGREIITIDIISDPLQSSPLITKLDPELSAYIIFTSGTTGTPKGVMISHRSLLNIILWHNTTFAMNTQSRSTLIAGIGFDVAQWEIWSALCSGATLVLPEEDVRLQPAALLDFFADHQITHAFVPTVLISGVVSAPQPEALTLQYLFTAGEKLHPVKLDQITYQLVDYYGPTEATIFATYNPVICATQNRPVTIGTPVADTEILILDEGLQPVSGDQAGELFIGGTCLARGYLNNPELTAEKFLTPDHFPGKRLYRSGDLARWLPDGRIQYLGRIDDQVKIRGNRVELGEIESLMVTVPGVKSAVATVTQPENPLDKKIVAFVVPDSATESPIAAIKRQLQDALPDYFLPADYQLVEQLPINANGKTNKAALLENYRPTRPERQHDAEPLDDWQQPIADIWCQLLALPDIAIDDNFFAIGGHSLLAASLATAINRQTGVKTYVRDIYEYPTFGSLTQALKERAGLALPSEDREPIRALQEDIYLPAGIVIDPHYEPRQISDPQTILLTGATGFIGSHLLAELLNTTRAEICCLVRDSSQEKASRRLQERLQRYHIALKPEQQARISVVVGNVAEDKFAMDPGQYEALSQRVDIVYHSASAVNFIQPYSYMKHDNVGGLREVIRFTAHRRTKPLMLLSTISVYSWGHLHTGKRVMLESDDIDQNLPAVISDIGYVRSKWVMEKIADLAASQGLPLMTFRLGYATSHSQTGVSASYQWWGRLVKTCIDSGTVPDLHNLREGLTTVDYMTRAIAHISRNPQALGKKFNLIHEHRNNLTLKGFFALLESHFGYQFTPTPFSEWLAQWEGDTQAPLYPLLSLFKDNMINGQSTVQLYQDTYQWDCRHVKQFLHGSGIEEPRFTQVELLRYLQRSMGITPLSQQA